MAEISKKYSTKFPREVIEEAYRIFKQHLEADSNLSFTEQHITRSSEKLTLDSESEFYYAYRDEIDEATLSYTYNSPDRIINKFSISYSKTNMVRDKNRLIEKSNIVVSLKAQDDVRSVLDVFDKNYSPLIDDLNISSIDTVRSKYSVEKQIPSCHVDKNLLEKVQNYFKKAAEENNISGIVIKISDSAGTEELPDIKNFASDYFPNDIQNISIDCGNYNSMLFISFSRKKDNSKLKLSIMGDQARDKAIRIDTDTMRMLNDYKNRNYIFYLIPIFPMLWLSFTLGSLGFIFIGKDLRQIYLDIAVMIVLMETVYAIFSHWNSYTTFRTRNYESHQGWINWLTLTTIEFILFSVLSALVLKRLGLT